MNEIIIAAFILAIFTNNSLLAESTQQSAQEVSTTQNQEIPYIKKEIAIARYGEKDRQELLKQAYQLQNTIAKKIVGQDRVGKAMQDRVVQYLENFGTRTKEPIQLHMIGLPGIGKSAMLEVLEQLGIKVFRVDAQRFLGKSLSNPLTELMMELNEAIEKQKKEGKPMILLLDEIDKVAELKKTNGGVFLEQDSSEFIGFLNQILTDGKVPFRYAKNNVLDLSNTMVITAMNFSPEEIEMFSKNALGKPKSFYDFTTEDFAVFDEWLRKEPAAVPKVLSRLFRSNTVSRLAPNTLIVKPLNHNDYLQIIKNNVENTIKATTSGGAAAKKITVTYSDVYLDFLAKHIIYPPSGARETIVKANALTEQLIAFGTKATGPSNISLVQPRSLLLDYDQEAEKVRIKVVPQYRQGKQTIMGEAFNINVDFDPDTKMFLQPKELTIDPPKIKNADVVKEKRISNKEVLGIRFPAKKNILEGFAEKINKKLIGQEEFTKVLESDLASFIGRPGPVEKNPPFRIIAGFPGIGKSELANLAGEYAGLPIARINMQAYSGTESKTLADFANALYGAIENAKQKSKDGKFILLIEELDKVFEVNPQTGAFVDRPIMNFVKDLLNDGYVKYIYDSGYGVQRTVMFDARNAYNIVTMNFAIDRFGFAADPRMTTIDDMIKAWKNLKGRPADLKRTLGSMFLPETVSRMMPRFMIMKPLEKKDYEKIIANQIETVIKNRLFDPKTGKNLGKIDVKLTPEYKKYLFSESVIPSEGARNTVLISQQRLALDLEDALKNIPKSSNYATKPLIIELDFKSGTSSVTAMATVKNSKLPTKSIKVFERPIELTFPPLNVKGKLPVKRMQTAVHEFGHAYAAVRLGKRIEYATVVPPKSGVGGYVKYKTAEVNSAKEILSSIYSTLASRAMERIFLSDDPLKSKSVLNITSGSSNDILQATQQLWDLMYEYGLDPGGGTIERRGFVGNNRYAHFSDIPDEDVKKLSMIMRNMEDYLVEDFLKANSKEWYIDKITKLAKAGGVNEKEFYKIIDYPYPGDNSTNIANKNPLFDSFKGKLNDEPKEINESRRFKQGLTKTTAGENLKNALSFFENTVQNTFHPNNAIKNLCSDGFAKIAEK